MGSNPIADMSGWSHSARKRKLALSPGVALRSKASAADMCGWSHRESFQLSISNLVYSESGSPFPDCREGLTDRLSSSVLLSIAPGYRAQDRSEEGRRHNHCANTGPQSQGKERKGKERLLLPFL